MTVTASSPSTILTKAADVIEAHRWPPFDHAENPMWVGAAISLAAGYGPEVSSQSFSEEARRALEAFVALVSANFADDLASGRSPWTAEQLLDAIDQWHMTPGASAGRAISLLRNAASSAREVGL